MATPPLCPAFFSRSRAPFFPGRRTWPAPCCCRPWLLSSRKLSPLPAPFFPCALLCKQRAPSSLFSVVPADCLSKCAASHVLPTRYFIKRSEQHAVDARRVFAVSAQPQTSSSFTPVRQRRSLFVSHRHFLR
jgi:hypothetical protein